MSYQEKSWNSNQKERKIEKTKLEHKISTAKSMFNALKVQHEKS